MAMLTTLYSDGRRVSCEPETKDVLFRQSVIKEVIFNVTNRLHMQRLGPHDGPSDVTLTGT